MKISFVAFALLAACIGAYAQQAAPNVDTVEPANGKIGAEITATGQNLQKEMVAKVYLTDGEHDLLVEVTQQTATTIKFKIPAKATGRMSLMVLTADKDPKYMQLPVKVSIDD
jgi:uncharacterized protein with GYD domain